MIPNAEKPFTQPFPISLHLRIKQIGLIGDKFCIERIPLNLDRDNIPRVTIHFAAQRISMKADLIVHETFPPLM